MSEKMSQYIPTPEEIKKAEKMTIIKSMILKDWWRTKSFWLKGGLIGLGISLLICLFLIIFLITVNEWWNLKVFLYSLPFLVTILAYSLPALIVFLGLSFSIGCILGWFINNIKSKK